MQVKRYERNVERLDTRAGHCERKLQTKEGEVLRLTGNSWNCVRAIEIIGCFEAQYRIDTQA